MTAKENAMRSISVSVDGRKQNGKLKFGHKWKSASGEWQTGEIVVRTGEPEHEIIFEVAPDSPKKLRFMADPNDAIWVSAGRCPKSKCNEGGQITPLSVEAGGTRLRVRNANCGEPVELHYMLRFRRKVPLLTRPHEYDPVIRNGGGGAPQ